ncbi:hypothetical protein PR048_005560 [Dryococelus australis]|uniref:Uncharacterized protein n=1 Tax=Dryococelus australis TaxID=614101 RepID=A0ABQ9I8J7_9NEOP|nr:hypothetical protein PR048_005560 [Dryococelus australis]
MLELVATGRLDTVHQHCPIRGHSYVLPDRLQCMCSRFKWPIKKKYLTSNSGGQHTTKTFIIHRITGKKCSLLREIFPITNIPFVWLNFGIPNCKIMPHLRCSIKIIFYC